MWLNHSVLVFGDSSQHGHSHSRLHIQPGGSSGQHCQSSPTFWGFLGILDPPASPRCDLLALEVWTDVKVNNCSSRRCGDLLGGRAHPLCVWKRNFFLVQLGAQWRAGIFPARIVETSKKNWQKAKTSTLDQLSWKCLVLLPSFVTHPNPSCIS